MEGFGRLRIGVGLLMLLVGIVLIVFYRDSEFGWFSGLPLGVALLVLGAFDVSRALRRDR